MRSRTLAIAVALVWCAAPADAQEDGATAASAAAVAEASSPQPAVEPEASSPEPAIEPGEPVADAEVASPDAATSGSALRAGTGAADADAPDDDALADVSDEATLEQELADEAGASEPSDEASAEEPATGAAVAEPEMETGTPAAAPAPMVLGELGYDADGQPGRIHVVVKGDTLWDISDAYLGTPWVWPSIWKDNREIDDPHLIHPGDRIWITPTEMRRVTRAEADALLSGSPVGDPGSEPLDDAPAALEEDSVPVPVPAPATVARETGRTLRVPTAETAGLVATEELDAAASVVGSPKERVFLGSGDTIYVGLGEGEVAEGDEFRLVRKIERVVDIETGADLGYHVAVLGWARVREVHPETATAEVRMAVDPIERGDALLPREERPSELVIKTPPAGVEGSIVFVAQHRLYTGTADRVYLNRGAIHGLEIGTELEVYESGALREDRVRGSEVQTPDEVVAHLVVVDVDPETATALVVSAEREITLGDRFRGRIAAVAAR